MGAVLSFEHPANRAGVLVGIPADQIVGGAAPDTEVERVLDRLGDHDAVGRVATRVAPACGARLLRYPLWAWHWARPGHRALRSWRPDLGVVAAYGKIIPEPIIELPRLGMINVHASLLPKYRGAAPVAWAIYHGETETGVSIIQMSPKLDAQSLGFTRQRLAKPLRLSVQGQYWMNQWLDRRRWEQPMRELPLSPHAAAAKGQRQRRESQYQGPGFGNCGYPAPRAKVCPPDSQVGAGHLTVAISVAVGVVTRVANAALPREKVATVDVAVVVEVRVLGRRLKGYYAEAARRRRDRLGVAARA